MIFNSIDSNFVSGFYTKFSSSNFFPKKIDLSDGVNLVAFTIFSTLLIRERSLGNKKVSIAEKHIKTLTRHVSTFLTIQKSYQFAAEYFSFANLPVISLSIATTTLVQAIVFNFFPESHFVKSWEVNHIKVKVVKENNSLRILTKESGSSDWKKGRKVVTPFKTLGAQIAFLEKCGAILEEGNSWSFSPPIYSEEENFILEDKIALYQGESGFFWQVDYWMLPGFGVKQLPLHNINCASVSDCDNDLITKFDLFKKRSFEKYVSKEEIRSFLSFFRLYETTVVDDLMIKFLPILETSHIDALTYVSATQWLVTLVCVDDRYCSSSAQHSEIVIEGIEGKKYFMKIGHLHYGKNKKSEVTLEDFTKKSLRYTSRTDIWKRNPQVVKSLMAAIEQDTKFPPNLYWAGGGSINATKNDANCISWALGKLKIIGVEYSRDWIDSVCVITTRYTSSCYAKTDNYWHKSDSLKKYTADMKGNKELI